MKKRKNVLATPLGVTTMDGRVIYDYQIGELEGKLLTLIDSFGFDENREKATKDLLRGFLRESLYRETRYIYGDVLKEAIKKQMDRERVASENCPLG